MKSKSYLNLGASLAFRLLLVMAVVSMLFVVAPKQPAQAQDPITETFTILDVNGDGLPPTTDLCSSGYEWDSLGSKQITLSSTPMSILSITFDLYYTTCAIGDQWEFYLNENLLGGASDPVQGDCICTPAASKYPQQITFSDSSTLTALWQANSTNELRVVPVGSYFAITYYGVSITYEPAVRAVISPSTQSFNVGGTAAFDASSSYSYSGNIVSYEWDFGDGNTGIGVAISHEYSQGGIYTVELTVSDDAGYQNSTTAMVYVSGPPQVITVPWRYNLPHETWNGNPAILKAVVKSLALPLSYTWDFGDGTSESGTITTEDAKYEIEAYHTYPDSSPETPYVATLTVTDPDGRSGYAQYRLVVKEKTLEVETNVAIDDGLWWAHKQIERYDVNGVLAGKWSEGYDIAPTAATVLAFEVQGHRPGGNPDQNPYIETVQRGLNHLFTRMSPQSINGQPYGNPDTNANGFGISLVSGSYTYEMGIVMMALAASGTPDQNAETGPANVIGRTYRDILTDLVDMCAWGQNEINDSGGRGGWRYAWNDYNSDNSATQWPVIGMESAETNWGIYAPEFVKRELDLWLATSQNPSSGGFGYTSAWEWVNPTKTGAGIAGLNFAGVAQSDLRVQNALSYLNNNWSYSGQDGVWNNNYGMYAIMKGMRTAQPEITMIGSHDWYTEFARFLVDQQSPDGSWPQSSGYTSGQKLDHAFAILILTPSVVSPPPVADLKIIPQQARPGAVFTFDGSGSYHLDPARQIVQYNFDFGDGTSYSETADNAPDGAFDGITTHVYPDTVESLEGLPGQLHEYMVSLTVTDDNPEGALMDTARNSLTISLENHPPVAIPGGPYIGYVNMPVVLDGIGSYDPDAGAPLYNHIVSYEWELDGIAPYDFDDGLSMAVNWTWTAQGTYNVGLRVTDRFGETNTAWTTVTIGEAIPTELYVNPDMETEYGDTINLEARLTTPTGDFVSGQLIKFWIDVDKNGSFDPSEFVGSAMTDETGWAALPYIATLTPDFYPVQAMFEGNDPYLPSLNDGFLEIEKMGTILTYTGPSSGYTGELVSLSVLLTDTDGNPLAGKQVDINFGSQPAMVLTGADGIGTVELTVQQGAGIISIDSSFDGDDYYEPSSDTDPFEITNSAPTIEPIDDQTADEGSTISVATTFADVDTGQTHSATVDWGDGVVEPAALNPQTGVISGSHLYKDNLPGDAAYAAKICVKDSADAETCAPFSVFINNVAPTVGSITGPIVPIAVNTSVSLSASFTDPGVLDTHTAVWIWNDGSTSVGTVVEANGSGTVTGSHNYATADIYTVKLTVTDKDGGTGESIFEYVVIYDPNGGFVTGGGWINSPEGAYKPDPTLIGKATFGFVSKYQKNQTMPTGNTEFQFHVAGMNFHSESYQWLIITGGNYARYKGTGTINGEGSYKFMIWAGDGTGAGHTDTFRIKIWSENQNGVETVIYDNGTDQIIASGSIIVHAK